MRTSITLVLLLFVTFTSWAQVKLKISLLPDEVTYQVSAIPEATYNTPLNSTPSAQISVTVPTGGFEISNLTNIKGLWGSNFVIAPVENPSSDYLIFALQGATSDITYQAGQEEPLFTFQNSGTCTGALALIDHDTDPFMPPNAQSINVGNLLSVIGAGLGINAYDGTAPSDADCSGGGNGGGGSGSGCGITIDNIIKTSPSACGVADGTIELEVTSTNALPLQYSINDGVDYQSDVLFTGLPAGEIFEIKVRDIAAICEVEGGNHELLAPLAAAITSLDPVNPTCGNTDGSITIGAFAENGGTLEYSIDNGATYQSSNSFQNLAPGTYPTWVQNLTSNCQTFIQDFVLIEDCSGSGGGDCDGTIEFVLEEISTGVYQVSLTPTVTWSFPQNITSTAQITIKVPSGGFVPGNINNLVSNVTFATSSTYVSPMAAPGFDYISFGMSPFGTTDIPYVEGENVPLFTFENVGTCTGGQINLMDNENDPFYPPNAENANVGCQITVSGFGGADVPVCMTNLNAVDCGTGGLVLIPSFNAPATGCISEAINFIDASNSNETINTWAWDFGDSNTDDTQNPTHTYASAGNYTVTLTITTDQGNQADFSQNITISENVTASVTQALFNLCSGETAQLEASGGMNYNWTPATGLSDPTIANPVATPTQTTTYTVTVSNPAGCEDTQTITVNVSESPTLNDVTFSLPNDCSTPNGMIDIDATGDNEYSIDGGTTWVTTSTFSALGDGTYTVLVRNISGDCEVAYTQNPIIFNVGSFPNDATFDITSTPLSGCDTNDGMLSVVASAGDFSFQWLDANNNEVGNTTTANALSAGNYTLIVTENNSSCTQTFNASVDGVAGINLTTSSTTSNSSCTGTNGAISFEITGGQAPYNFSLLSAGQTIDTQMSTTTEGSFSGLATGSYSVTITDDIGCTANFDFTIESDVPAFGIDAMISDANCGEANGAITILNAPTSATFVWAGNAETSATLSNIEAGSYAVTITNQDGCQEMHTFVVSTLDGVPVSIDQLTHVECGGASDGAVAFTIQESGNFTYEIAGANITGTSNGMELIVEEGLSLGGYVILVTDLTNNCQSTTIFAITQNAPYQIIATASAPSGCDTNDASVCLLIEGGTSPYTITSDMGDAPAMPFETNGCIENLTNGTVNITVTDVNGCSLTTPVEIDYPTIEAITAADVTITDLDCPYDATGSITSNTALEYVVRNDVGVIVGSTPLMDLESGDYIVSYTMGACIEELAVNIGAPTPWDIDIVSTPSDCSGNSGTLTINIPNTNNYSFVWENTISNTNQAVNLSPDQIYRVIITEIATGCMHIIDGLVVENDCTIVTPPVVATQIDTLNFTIPVNSMLENICLATNELTSVPSEISICGLPSNGSVEVESMLCLEYTPDVDFLGQDQFCAIICDDTGICDTTIIIIQTEQRELEIYQGFSPNNDGVNDFFMVKNIEFYPNHQIRIFNRWGTLVFKTDNYRNNWSGKYRSATLPDGTYFYIIDDGNGNRFSNYLQINR